MKNLLFVLLLSFACLFKTKGQIVINEYSAANYDTYTDNYGEYEDWVELYNTSANPVDINGWYLTDKPSNPTKWMIPSSFVVPWTCYSRSRINCIIRTFGLASLTMYTVISTNKFFNRLQ